MRTHSVDGDRLLANAPDARPAAGANGGLGLDLRVVPND
jgi:hypothetical protein